MVHFSRNPQNPVAFKKQQGQALVSGLVLLMITFAGLIVLFSRAQLTAEKQRLTSASDAAAYSAALWRARVMNFDAYSNRAIIAQEVAVAQATTLVSWSKYFESFAGNLNQIAAIYPPLMAVSGPIANAATLSRQVTETAAQLEIPARAANDVGYKFLLEQSQRLMGLTANGFALNLITAEVARANHPEYFAYTLPGFGTSFSFVKRYETDEERKRLRDLVQRSLDPFTGQSRAESLRLLTVPSFCALNLNFSWAQRFQHLRKRGGTSLSEDMERWEAVDTVSLHNFSPRGGFLGLFRSCRESETLPLGYGAAEAADQEMQGAVVTNDFDINKNSSAKAIASVQIKGFDQYGGLSRVHDLDYDHPDVKDKKYPVSDITVVSRIGAADLRTANTLNLGVGRFRNSETLNRDRLKVLSAAQVYFRKPTQSPMGMEEEPEYASLFSPYWQARLIAPTQAQRAVAAVAP
jgi:hypothetical protein